MSTDSLQRNSKQKHTGLQLCLQRQRGGSAFTSHVVAGLPLTHCLLKAATGLAFPDLTPTPTENHLRLPVAFADNFVKFPGYSGPLVHADQRQNMCPARLPHASDASMSCAQEVGGFVRPILKYGPSGHLVMGREISFTHNLTGVDPRCAISTNHAAKSCIPSAANGQCNKESDVPHCQPSAANGQCRGVYDRMDD